MWGHHGDMTFPTVMAARLSSTCLSGSGLTSLMSVRGSWGQLASVLFRSVMAVYINDTLIHDEIVIKDHYITRDAAEL